MNQDQLKDFAQSLRQGMFADRATVKEAFDYAYAVIEALPESERIYVLTALHVVVNTIANQLTKE